MIERIAIIGYGEVGKALSPGLPVPVRTFDTDPEKRAKCASIGDAVQDADLIISAVTAAQTLNAAEAAVPFIKRGAWYMDLNSASPGTKMQAAKRIDGAGGRYVEVAVMSPIEPKRLASPMLLGGPHAEAFALIVHALGFGGASFYSTVLGEASATKLCRSVMIKGLEALISESLLSARFYGVEDVVLDSLGNLFPHSNWPGYARYMISRTLVHGRRRAEEMREAAQTVADAGIEPLMSEACARRQDWAANHALAYQHEDLKAMLDAILRSSIVKPNTAEE